MPRLIKTPANIRYTPLLVGLVVSLPFLVLLWLLVNNALAHHAQHAASQRVLTAFAAGLAAVRPLGDMRDLAPAHVLADNADINARYAAVHAEADLRLQALFAAVDDTGNKALAESAQNIRNQWQTLAVQGGDDNQLLRPFENAAVVLDSTYGLLAMLIYLSDLSSAQGVHASELLLFTTDAMRRARTDVGLLRAIAVNAAARDGYLSSSDTELLDSAWNSLFDNVTVLERNLHGLAQRTGLHPGTSSGNGRAELAVLRSFLADTEESLIYNTRIEHDWAWYMDNGGAVLDEINEASEWLLAGARRTLDANRAAQLRQDIGTGIALLLFYALAGWISLALYRSRYTALHAQAESMAKGRFLARMSHEIRTPLNGVIGLAELLRDTNPTPRQQEYIALIESSGRSLVSLVNDILDYAKVEAGKLQLEQLPVDIRAVAQECIEVLSLPAGDNHDLLLCQVDADVPRTFIGDPVRLRQVLLNLVSNAVKFTERGRVELRVSCRHDGPAGALRIRVVDTGIGISADEQERLFDLFTQASASVARRYGGTGLGLGISRQLVELMGGQIGVDSRKGEGSTFWFDIPYSPEAATAAPAPPAPLPATALLLDLDGHLAAFIATVPELAGALGTVASVPAARALLAQRDDIGLVVVAGAATDPRWLEDVRQLRGALRPGQHLRLLAGVHAAVDVPAWQAAGVDDIVNRSAFGARQLQALFSREAQAAPAPGTSGNFTQSALPAGLRVLVAEDNEVNQIVTRGLLRRLGVEPVVVADGRAAVDLYTGAEGRYDVVLMDMDMPVMDGLAATRALRALQQERGWPHTVVLALSAHALPEHGEMARAAGMDGHLVKPVNLESLGRALRDALARARRDAAGSN